MQEIQWLDDVQSLAKPLETMPQETVEDWYKDNCALFSVTVDTSKQAQCLADIRALLGDKGMMAGGSVDTVAVIESTSSELSRKDDDRHSHRICDPAAGPPLAGLSPCSSWLPSALPSCSTWAPTSSSVPYPLLQAAGAIYSLPFHGLFHLPCYTVLREFRRTGMDVQQAMVEAVKIHLFHHGQWAYHRHRLCRTDLDAV